VSADFGKIFGKALRYAFSFDRILPFFVVDLIIVVSILVFLNSLVNAMLYFGGDFSSLPLVGQASVGSFFSTLLIFAIIIIVLVLVQLFFSGAIADNARLSYGKKEQHITSSFAAVKKRYWSILGATILTGLISSAVNIVPYIGWIISFIVSWFFIFIVQAVIISNKGAVDALKDSYKLFMKNKLDVIVFWLLLAIIGFAIFLIALLPVGIIMLPIILSAKTLSAMALIKSSMPLILICGVIFAAFLAYMNVFQEAARTFFYLNVRKK